MAKKNALDEALRDKIWDLPAAIALQDNFPGNWEKYRRIAVKQHPKGVILIAEVNDYIYFSTCLNEFSQNHGEMVPYWTAPILEGEMLDVFMALPDYSPPMEEPEFTLDEIVASQELIK